MGTHCSSMDDILEEDMHHWYTKFMRESPSGLITLFELKAMLEMNGMTEEASSYVDQVFFTFDMDGVRKQPATDFFFPSSGKNGCNSIKSLVSLATIYKLIRQLFGE